MVGSNFYNFRIKWRAATDWRLAEVAAVILTLKRAFGFPAVYDPKTELEVPINVIGLERIYNESTDRGAIALLPAYPRPTGTDDKPPGMGFQLSMGNPAGSVQDDYLSFGIGEVGDVLSKVEYLQECVCSTSCAEAYLSDWETEWALNPGLVRNSYFMDLSKPRIIVWWQYLDSEMVKNLGGIDFCLKAPAWRVQKFRDGILIQLTEEEFDSEKATHRKVVENVMRYFDLWDLPPLPGLRSALPKW